MSTPFSAVFLALMLTPEAPPLQSPAPERPDPQYQACVGRIGDGAAEARSAAERWVSEGGGAAAQHCLAVAELADGHPVVAAIRLTDLAGRSDAGDELVRARILSQAALAWVEAEKPLQAKEAIKAAFAAAPGAGELYLAAAKVYAANEEYEATIEAVTTAEEKGFTSAEGHVLRGKALHALTRHRAAADDVVAALTIDPFNLDALVLRGDLAQAGIDIEAYYSDAGGDQ